MNEHEQMHDMVHEFAHSIKGALAIVKEGLCLVSDGVVGQVTEDQKSVLASALKGVEKINTTIVEYYKKFD